MTYHSWTATVILIRCIFLEWDQNSDLQVPGSSKRFKCFFHYSGCTPCLPGTFCGRAGLEQPSGDCAGGWYCIRAAWSDKPVDVGVLGYCNATNTSGCFCPNTTTGGVCQPGYYCPNGSREPIPCLKGTTNPFKLSSFFSLGSLT